MDAKSITDDDLLFLHQIGLQWVRLEIGEGDTTFEDLRTAQQRRYARRRQGRPEKLSAPHRPNLTHEILSFFLGTPLV
jgi:hypothetical protein